MSEILVDLLFWIIIFVVFFYGFKWLQQRKRNKKSDDPDTDA